jgi:hypothetical protein
MLDLKPYWGKPAVRNFRGGDGNVGIIRSPVRAIALLDLPPTRGYRFTLSFFKIDVELFMRFYIELLGGMSPRIYVLPFSFFHLRLSAFLTLVLDKFTVLATLGILPLRIRYS